MPIITNGDSRKLKSSYLIKRIGRFSNHFIDQDAKLKQKSLY